MLQQSIWIKVTAFSKLVLYSCNSNKSYSSLNVHKINRQPHDTV